MMLFRIPIMYTASVIHQGKRKAIDTTVFEWIDSEIEVADDAPVATKWQDPSGRTQMTLWHKDSHWIQYDTGDDDTSIRHLSTTEMASELAQGRSLGNPLAVGSDWMLREFAEGKRPAFNPDDYRKVLETSRDKTVAEAVRKARDVLIARGMVWKRSAEPIYVLTRPTRQNETQPPVMRPLVTTLNTPKPASDMFRADRFEDLADETMARWGMDGQRQIKIDEEARIKVLFPESIRYDDEKSALLAAVERILDNQRRNLPTAALYKVRAWLEASEALEEAQREWTQESAGKLENATETWTAVMTADDSYFSGKMREALDRWKARPIGNEFDDPIDHRPGAKQ